MSGIFGCLGRVSEDTVSRARVRLLHRGEAEYAVTRPEIFLACRTTQLKAVSSVALDVPLVYSGLITNRVELAGLQHRGVPDEDDAANRQLLWDLYCRFGTPVLERINGTFALALAEAESHSLLLAVDRWAARPLYFAEVEDGWMFASECKALLAALKGQAELDRSVAQYVSGTKYLPLQRTLTASIGAVGPGQWVRIHAGGIEVGVHSPFRLHVRTDTSEAACASELREHLLTAARRVIEPFDRVGIGLSGGLDSVLTLGAVRRVAPNRRVFTYTVAFHKDDPVFAKARRAAEYFGTEHREIVIEAEQIARLLPEMLWRMEDPVAREEMLVYHVLAQRAAAEVPIVLYGHMADMLFAGMPRHLLVKLASKLRLLRGPLMQFYDYTQTGRRPIGLIARSLVLAHSRGRCIEAPRAVRAEQVQGKCASIVSPEPLNSSLMSALTYPSEISAIERLHAWAGVELASIFHDREVAAYAFRIPDHLKIRGRSRKYILRAAASDILPPQFAERSKDLIRIKRDERLRSVTRQLREELLSPDALRQRALFATADVEELGKIALSERVPDEAFYHLWTLLLIEIWCRTFLDPAAPEPQHLLGGGDASLRDDVNAQGLCA